jgi:hypothetical protein
MPLLPGINGSRIEQQPYQRVIDIPACEICSDVARFRDVSNGGSTVGVESDGSER